MPGKFGDVLWSMVVCRAISQTYGVPVDFVLSKETPSILPLLQQQPYIGKAWQVDPWHDHPTELGAQIRPSVALEGYDRVFHLSYRGWPTYTLPREIYRNAEIAYTRSEGELARLDLDTPWITSRTSRDDIEIAVGFSDEWFELKYGICELLRANHALTRIFPKGSRWDMESYRVAEGSNWVDAAAKIKKAKFFLGCCSALHVLACALGKSVVMVEPNAARHNPIFYPYGKTGRVHLVCGNDGLPTHDSRHVREALLSTREQR